MQAKTFFTAAGATFIVLAIPILIQSGQYQGNDIGLSLPLVFFCAGVLAFLRHDRLRFKTLAVVTGAMLALFLKIYLDVQVDPTAHNLLPFELVIDGFLFGIAALFGGGAGTFFKWLRNRTRPMGK